jgi:hypothetical protein
MRSRPNRNSIPRLRHQRRSLLRRRCRPPLRSPNPCRWITRSRKSSLPKLRQPEHRRSWRPPRRRRAMARRGHRTRRRINLDYLPRPAGSALSRVLVCAIGGVRIRKRCPPQAARLRLLLGGRDQLRDKNRAGEGPLRARALRPLRRWDHRDQRDTGRFCVHNDAVFHRLLRLTGTQHRKSRSG